MAYLNDIKLVSYLANVPEMAMTRGGRPYSNIKVRLVQKTRTGEERCDFISVTCFDYNAEVVVRDGRQGDLIMVVGHVAQHRWERDGKLNSQVIVVADHVSILAVGTGSLPPPSLEDVRNADLCIQEDGVVAWTTGKIYTGKGRTINSYDYGRSYPQPRADGTWSVPVLRGAPGVREWQRDRGMAVSKGVYVERNPSVNGVPVWTGDARLKNIAEGIYPDNLQPHRGYVRLPNGKKIRMENYANIIAGQDRTLMGLPEPERETVIALAGKIKGIHLQYERYFPAYRQRMLELEQQRQAQAQAQEAAELEKRKDTEGQAPVHEGADGANDNNADNGDNDDNGAETSAAPIAGANPDEWYQDEEGKWQRKKLQ